jgi:hypothetical protein
MTPIFTSAYSDAGAGGSTGKTQRRSAISVPQAWHCRESGNRMVLTASIACATIIIDKAMN